MATKTVYDLNEESWQQIRENFELFIEKNIDYFITDEHQLKYWFYIDIETLEIKVSAPLTGGTIPNPANWYPNTSDILFWELQNYEGLEDEDIEYYRKQPEDFYYDFSDFVGDLWDTLVNAVNAFIEGKEDD